MEKVTFFDVAKALNEVSEAFGEEMLTELYPDDDFNDTLENDRVCVQKITETRQAQCKLRKQVLEVKQQLQGYIDDGLPQPFFKSLGDVVEKLADMAEQR